MQLNVQQPILSPIVDKSDPAVKMIYRAVQALSGVDDGAQTRDGSGFNKMDTQFGRSLAEKPWEAWSPRMVAFAYKMIRKYRIQLMKYHEIDFSLITIIPDPDEIGKVQQPAAQVVTRVKQELVKELYFDPESNEIVLVFKGMDRPTWNEIYMVVKEAGARFELSDKTWRFPFSQSGAVSAVDVAIKFEFESTVEDQQKIGAMAEQGKVLEEASKAHDADFDVPGIGGTMRPFQRAGVRFVWMTKRCIVADDMGLGKQQPIDTNVLAPRGWREIGTLNPGDLVIGSNGKPTAVRGIYPQGIKDCYRVTFSDGSSVEAGLEHLWTVRYWKGGEELADLVLTTEQLMNRPVISLQRKDGRVNNYNLAGKALYLPMLTAPVEFDKQSDLPIPPYTLGQMISNGSLAHATPKIICNAEDESDIRRNMIRDGVTINEIAQHGNVFKFSISGMVRKVKFLGLDVLSSKKFIPREYLTASPENRVSLFHGLMDGDGSVSSTRNKLAYSTMSYQLALDFIELVEGLGGIASCIAYDRTKEEKGIEYHVRLRLPKWVAPFTTERKMDKYHPGRLALPVRTVLSVEFTRQVEAVCIAVDAPDKLYVTEHCILTHNTIEGIIALFVLNAFPALIVCPASIKINWLREVLKWLPGINAIILKNKVSIAELQTLAPQICIINYENLNKNVKALNQYNWQGIIFDEAHRLKTANAQRSQAAMKIAYRSDEEIDWREKKDREKNAISVRIALTGTPVQNRPSELLNLLKVIGRIYDVSPKGVSAFLKRYCGSYDGYGYTGASNTEELHNILRQTCMIRRMKAEVLTELPPIQRSIITFEIDNRTEYRKAEKDIIHWVGQEAVRKAKEDQEFMDSIAHLSPDGQLDALQNRKRSAEEKARRAKQLVRIEKLKTLAARGKMKQIKEWIEEFLETDEKLIVFANHIEIQKKLTEAFPGSAKIYSEDNAEKRQVNIDRFQNDPGCRTIMCSLIAGGEGITLTASSNVAFAELGWTPAGHDQAEARSHRMGNKGTSITAWYFIAKDTIEEQIATLLDAKREIVNAVTDGREMEEGESLMEGIWDYLKQRAEAEDKPEDLEYDEESEEDEE